MNMDNVSAQAMDMRALKESMRAMWMAGDFGVVAKTITGGAEASIGRIGNRPGMRVLDVVCGTAIRKPGREETL